MSDSERKASPNDLMTREEVKAELRIKSDNTVRRLEREGKLKRVDFGEVRKIFYHRKEVERFKTRPKNPTAL
jgi:hypothetical protein